MPFHLKYFHKTYSKTLSKLEYMHRKRKDISKSDLMLALKNLNDVWKYLYPAEQRKIANMLINRVEIHTDGIKLDMNLEGFDDLLLQLSA